MAVSFRCFREADAFGNATAMLISVSSCLLRNANLNLKLPCYYTPLALVSIKWIITPLVPWTAAQFSTIQPLAFHALSECNLPGEQTWTNSVPHYITTRTCLLLPLKMSIKCAPSIKFGLQRKIFVQLLFSYVYIFFVSVTRISWFKLTIKTG